MSKQDMRDLLFEISPESLQGVFALNDPELAAIAKRVTNCVAICQKIPDGMLAEGLRDDTPSGLADDSLRLSWLAAAAWSTLERLKAVEPLKIRVGDSWVERVGPDTYDVTDQYHNLIARGVRGFETALRFLESAHLLELVRRFVIADEEEKQPSRELIVAAKETLGRAVPTKEMMKSG